MRPKWWEFRSGAADEAAVGEGGDRAGGQPGDHRHDRVYLDPRKGGGGDWPCQACGKVFGDIHQFRSATRSLDGRSLRTIHKGHPHLLSTWGGLV